MNPVSKIALALVACVAPIAATASQLSNSAPADQYFGPLKMSALGVRNRLSALGKRYHARTITDTDIIHDAKLIEASMAAWQKAYPGDPWIVSTYFHLEQVYQVVQSTNGRTHATIVLKFIAKEYPKTKQAHLSRLRLAQGFPPLHALPAPHATPDPYAPPSEPPSTGATPVGAPAPTSSGSPAPAASDVPASIPSAAPSPSTSPAASPSVLPT